MRHYGIEKDYTWLWFFFCGLATIGLIWQLFLWGQDDSLPKIEEGISKNSPSIDLEYPDFSEYQVERDRRLTYVAFVAKLIAQCNQKIELQRQELQYFLDIQRVTGGLTSRQRALLAPLVQEYQVKETEDLSYLLELQKRLQPVPIKLLLARSALDTQWGRNKYYRQSNQVFNHRCFVFQCHDSHRGTEDTDENATDLKSFSSVFIAVKEYVHQLNVHPDNALFREVRWKILQTKSSLNSEYLLMDLQTHLQDNDSNDYRLMLNMVQTEVDLESLNENELD